MIVMYLQVWFAISDLAIKVRIEDMWLLLFFCGHVIPIEPKNKLRLVVIVGSWGEEKWDIDTFSVFKDELINIQHWIYFTVF